MTKKYGNYSNTSSTSVDPSSSAAPGGWNNAEVSRELRRDTWPRVILKPDTLPGEVVYAASSGVADTHIDAGFYLLPDGSEVSRTTYLSLFNVVGTLYGNGDTVNTFNLPNYTRDHESFLKCATPSGLTLADMSASGVLPGHVHTGTLTTDVDRGSEFGSTPYTYQANQPAVKTEPSGTTAGNTMARFYLSPLVSTGRNEIKIGCVFPLTGVSNNLAVTELPVSSVVASGQAISRSDYSTLFGLIGTTYGSGDGSTTFNIPDLRGSFVGHPYPSLTLASGDFYTDEFASHFHQETARIMTSFGGDAGGTSVALLPLTGTTTNSTVNGSESRPNNLYVIYCMTIS